MASLLTSSTLLYAILGGLLPTLLWLWFWLHEDKRNPEPKGLIFLTFISGMVAVPIAIFFEMAVSNLFWSAGSFPLSKILVWAAIEEVVKFLMVYLGAFHTKSFDEPIDAVVYMITAALGFAALENMLFLTKILDSHGIVAWFSTGNSRFLGATVLHTIASGLVGAAVGFTFYKKKSIRLLAVLIGLTTAILLHAAFNFSIIVEKGKNTMIVFFVLWVIALFAIMVFEKVRKTRRVK